MRATILGGLLAVGLFVVGCGGAEAGLDKPSGPAVEATGTVQAAVTCQSCWDEYYTCMRLAGGEIEEVNACIEQRMACTQTCT